MQATPEYYTEINLQNLTITPSSRIQFNLSDGRIVLIRDENHAMDLDNVAYLNDTSAFIWTQLENGCDFLTTLDKMCVEYMVDKETACDDLVILINELIAKKFLEVKSD